MKLALPAIAALGLAFAAALPAAAQSPAADAWSIGANIGTPGLGAELKYDLNAVFALRATVDGASVSHNVDYDGLDYNGKLKMLTGGAFADVHPFSNGFLLSGGAYFGKRKIDIHAVPGPSTSVNIGNAVYTGAQIGTLDGRVKMSDATPFAGLGFDNSFTRAGHWGFKALAGVAFSKRPEVTLVASGPLSGTPQFQAELARELTNISDDAKDFRYFPVVQVGLSYKF